MSTRHFIPRNKITAVLLSIFLSTAILLVACAELPSLTPTEPAEPAIPKETPVIPETPVTPAQPPIKPEAVPSPAPLPAPPAPIPSPPPTKEKPTSNGLVEPQATSTTTNGGASKIFLNVDGITGESLDVKHDEWIDVISFSHGISQSTSSSTSRTTGVSTHAVFTVVKELDKASPKLALACCKGDYIPAVIIEVCRADTSDKYMRYTLTDVIVASIAQNGSSQGENARPIEEISLRYGRIDWSYTEIDPVTSTAKGNVEAYWDIETDKGG